MSDLKAFDFVNISDRNSGFPTIYFFYDIQLRNLLFIDLRKVNRHEIAVQNKRDSKYTTIIDVSHLTSIPH